MQRDIYQYMLTNLTNASWINNLFCVAFYWQSLIKKFGRQHEGALHYLLQHAVLHGCVIIVKRLLRCKYIDPCGNRLLRRAIVQSPTSIVKLLLNDVRVDPTTNDNEAIIVASGHGRTDVVQAVLANPRVDPAARKHAAVRCAIQDKHQAVVDLLFADPRTDFAWSEPIAITDTLLLSLLL